jgi:hypothetical protein
MFDEEATMKRRLFLSVLLALLLVGAADGLAATQPQTLTVCMSNRVPAGWLVIKEFISSTCAPGFNNGVNTMTITPVPDVIGDAGPWKYQIMTNTSGALTLFRSNSATQQLCKISISAGAASFACADVTASVISLPELLKR